MLLDLNDASFTGDIVYFIVILDLFGLLELELLITLLLWSFKLLLLLLFWILILYYLLWLLLDTISYFNGAITFGLFN